VRDAVGQVVVQRHCGAVVAVAEHGDVLGGVRPDQLPRRIAERAVLHAAALVVHRVAGVVVDVHGDRGVVGGGVRADERTERPGGGRGRCRRDERGDGDARAGGQCGGGEERGGDGGGEAGAHDVFSCAVVGVPV